MEQESSPPSTCYGALSKSQREALDLIRRLGGIGDISLAIRRYEATNLSAPPWYRLPFSKKAPRILGARRTLESLHAAGFIKPGYCIGADTVYVETK